MQVWLYYWFVAHIHESLLSVSIALCPLPAQFKIGRAKCGSHI